MTPYRQTHIRENLRLRAGILQLVRRFFNDNHFLEVETPIRLSAPAPERHIEPIPCGSWCLQPSPELFMKRLLSAGYARIFQICKCFRHRERGRNHLSEFTMLEWYCAGIDYFDFMAQCEGLIRAVAHGLGSPDTLHYRNHIVDISAPWSRISVADAFSRWAKLTPEAALAQDRFEEIMVNDIEPMLGFDKPAFLYDYPAACGSLAKLDPLHSNVAQRFELYICGLELCNAFVELTDPVEQRVRFENERSAMARAGKTCYALPEAFLSALGDMPEAAGNALGIDRLVMLFTNARCIDDVVAFTPEES